MKFLTSEDMNCEVFNWFYFQLSYEILKIIFQI